MQYDLKGHPCRRHQDTNCMVCRSSGGRHGSLCAQPALDASLPLHRAASVRVFRVFCLTWQNIHTEKRDQEASLDCDSNQI